ncbi:MAG TPA: 50S ribosomal protein L3 [Planctomycetota bacterium]|nr:MAG: 50S ribosomal protein L3 [Planctomycetes bacterium ADurb.Bin069]HNU26999.1 50S ribosomal protein L3 [Planctomycetota bacterium]HOE30244.1 50S ribosomal protein L3 [Planctomycetota bacterium]HOE87286.1 50S ribosomal protein L3 [Planctomycetota bacterium]HOR67865.1 50S ribosomal protein L3 [Planctomycetota bacterium]
MSQNRLPALLGRKLGMTQVFAENGDMVPVTMLEIGPCTVLQVKTVERDGYAAWKVGFGTTRKKPTKAMAGVFAQAGGAAARIVGEVPPIEGREVKAGDQLTVAVFEGVARINVAGTSKGRGFSGTIRRHNFSSGPRAHGSKNVREIGSAGSVFNARVLPGKPMPGQWGNCRATVQNLGVVKIDPARNLLVVRGAVPGPPGGYVVVQESTYKR